MKTFRQIANHLTSMCAHFSNATGLTLLLDLALRDPELTWDEYPSYFDDLVVKISVEELEVNMKPRKRHRLRLQQLYRKIETKYHVELWEDEPIENPEEDRACGQATTHNQDSISHSQMCGCYSCGKIFPASEVTPAHFTKDGTACCPYCGVDSVFGDASGLEVTKKNLKKLHKRWFGNF